MFGVAREFWRLGIGFLCFGRWVLTFGLIGVHIGCLRFLRGCWTLVVLLVAVACWFVGLLWIACLRYEGYFVPSGMVGWTGAVG